MTRSLSILLPAAMGYDANRVLAAAGLGPRNFTILCYASGLMIGLHARERDVARYIAPTAPSGGWAAHDLTPARVAEITGAMAVSDLPHGVTPPPESFAALAGSQGVTWGEHLPNLPAPGSNATVTAGEFYRTDQPGFAVVKVIQTHVLNNPEHDDLRLLLALYEAQRDPFNPEPWVPSQGAAGVYPTRNLIGGPQLAAFEGKVYENTYPDNPYAPNVYGWEIWTWA